MRLFQKIKTIKTDTSILFFICIFHIINNFIWAKLDISPTEYDQSVHLHLCFKYLNLLTNPTENFFHDLLNVESYYPPLFHLSMQPFLYLFGISEDTLVIGNGFYLGLISIFTYLIANQIFNRKTALLSSFFVSIFPYLLQTSRNALIDVALTCIVTISIFFLIKSKYFIDKFYSVLFGFTVGLGMLTKWTFLFFLIGPFVMYLFHCPVHIHSKTLLAKCYKLSFSYIFLFATFFLIPILFFILTKGIFILILLEILLIYLLVKYLPYKDNKQTINSFLSILISLFTCLPWYLFNIVNLIKGTKFASAGTGEGDPTELLEMFLYYIQSLPHQIGLIFSILFVIGIIILVVRFKIEYSTILIWVIIPYIIFSLINNKDYRFTLPYLPAIAIITAYFFGEIIKRPFSKIMVIAIIIFGFYQFFLTSYNLSLSGRSLLFNQYAPKNEDWKHEEILSDIAFDVRKEKPIIVKILANHWAFNRGNFRDVAEINNLSLVSKIIKKKKYFGTFSDYVITKTGYLGPYSTESREIRDLIPQKDAFKNTLTVFKTYLLPDNSEAIVYKIDPKPYSEFDTTTLLNIIKKKLKVTIQNYPKYGLFDAGNFQLEIVPYDDSVESQKGHFKQIKIFADSALIDKKVKIRNISVVFSSISLNLYELINEGKIILFNIDSISLKAEIVDQDIEKALHKEIKEVKDIKIRLENDQIDITGKLNIPYLPNWNIHVTGKIILDQQSIKTQVSNLEIGNIRIPAIMYRKHTIRNFPLIPSSGWPMYTQISKFIIDKGKIVIK